jgi:CBS domain-containing protein
MNTKTPPNTLRAPLEATVAEAMTPRLVHCRPDTSLRDVAHLMTTHGIHAVYVFDDVSNEGEPPALWGLVTDLDLVASWPVLEERSAGGTAVTPLVMVPSDEPLGRAAQLMAESGTAHLAVTDPVTGAPVGVLSTMDIARVIAGGLAADVV